MAIERVVVFQFHHSPLVCRANVDMLRRLNPGIAVHGILGTPAGPRQRVLRLTSERLVGVDSLYTSRHSGYFNWKNCDLVVLDWFREVGRYETFDVAHVVQWDLLLTERLDRLYAHVPPQSLGLTAHVPLSEVDADWRWISEPEEARQWSELLAHARDRYGYDGVPHACIGGGVCFPRAFLEDYAAADPPDLCIEELRMPLFAQLLGHPVTDTGFWRRNDPGLDRFFNLGGPPIEPATITAELAQPDGHRVFHPVVQRVNGLPRGT